MAHHALWLAWSSVILVACASADPSPEPDRVEGPLSGEDARNSAGTQGSAGSQGDAGQAGESAGQGGAGEGGSAGQGDGGQGGSAKPPPECQAFGTQDCETPDGFPGYQGCKGGVWSECVKSLCVAGQVHECTEGNAAGWRACKDSQWTECFSSAICRPGDTEDYVCPDGGGKQTQLCLLQGSQWNWTPKNCNDFTPLVLSLGGAPVEFTRPGGFFDVVGAATCTQTDWVSAATPWLALDRDGNGSIDDGSELFGSMTRLPSGELATNGFAALAALDRDGDGWLTAADPSFARLVLWSDRDQNRRSSPSELKTLAQEGVEAIELGFTVSPRCHEGSCEVERARVKTRDERARGAVIDVHLARR